MFRIGVSSCRNVGVIFLECCWNVMQACIGELTNAYVVYFFVEKVFLFWYVQYTRKGGSIFECESFEIIILVLVWHLIMVVYCVKNYLPMS